MTDEVRSLLERYCELIDAGDFDAVGDLFTNGALLDPNGNELARGGRAVAEFYRRTVLVHDGTPRTEHFVFATTSTEEGMSSAYLVLQDGRPIIAGRYLDRFERTQDGLRFAERRFFVDLVGDLSGHLTERSSSALG